MASAAPLPPQTAASTLPLLSAADADTVALLQRLAAASSLPTGQVLAEALRLWAESHGMMMGDSEPPAPEVPGSSAPTQRAAGRAARADWAATSEWLPRVFGRLSGQPEELAKARLVCRGWAGAVLGSLRRLHPKPSGAPEPEHSVAMARQLLRRCTGLRELTVDTTAAAWRAPPSSEASVLLTEATALPQLRCLRMYEEALAPEHLAALRPLLPRLRAFSLATRASGVSQVELADALGMLSRITSLELDVANGTGDNADPVHGVPLAALTSLPTCLTSLRLERVHFGSSSLTCLASLPSLKSLWLARCAFTDRMGLTRATALTHLTLCVWMRPGEADLEDILTLHRLQQLRIATFDPPPGFLSRLPGALPSLTSLALQSWESVTDEALAPLGALTRLTRLDVSAEDTGESTALTGHGLEHLTRLTGLKQLTLGHHAHHEFLRRGLPHLTALTNLTSLDIHDAEINSFVAGSLPEQLRHLGLECCFPPEEGASVETARTLAALADRCTSLTSVDLSFNDTVSLEGLAELTSLPDLRQIQLDSESTLFAPLHELPRVLSALLKVWPSAAPHHAWYHRELMPGSVRGAAAAVEHLCAEVAAQPSVLLEPEPLELQELELEEP